MKNIAYAIFVFSVFFAACNNKADNKNKECCKKSDSSLTAGTNRSAESIYQLQGEWKDQDGKKVMLNSLKGKVQVVAMVFSNCSYACPKIVADIQDIEKKLSSEKKIKLTFYLSHLMLRAIHQND